MRLNVWGSIYGETGFDVHARNLAMALMEVGADVAVEAGARPDAVTFLKQPERLRAAVGRNYSYDTTVAIVHPEWWVLKSGDRIGKFYGFGVFEGTMLPVGWIRACNSPMVTGIMVPSEHTAAAFRASGVEKPLHVVPHGVDEKLYNPQVTVPEELKDDNFNFLFVGGWRDGIHDRKGLDLALKAYCAEFGKDEKVRFNVKIHGAYGRLDYLSMVRAVVPPAGERAQISVLVNDLTGKELAGLYRSADCFVMPSKAEAFCLPCAEAMACGVPVISHAYGGQADYIRDGVDGYLIATERMIPAFEDGASEGNRYIYERAKWGLPDVKQLRERMRYLFDNPGEARKMGAAASESILGGWKWTDAARKLLKVVEGENEER